MSKIIKSRVLLNSNGEVSVTPFTIDKSTAELLEPIIYEKEKELMIQASEEIQNPEEK